MTNYNSIKRSVRQDARHKTFRKIRQPKALLTRHARAPFSNEFTARRFRYDIYVDMKPLFLLWIWLKPVILYTIPGVMVHTIYGGLNMVASIVEGSPQTMVLPVIQLIGLVYAICLAFAYRKITDHTAHINTFLNVTRYDINRLAERFTMELSVDELRDHKEFNVINHYRKKAAKSLLFPTVKEFAASEQAGRKERGSQDSRSKRFGQLRQERMNLDQIREEHYAAKEVADWLQIHHGGPNQYIQWANRYAWRTTPAIRKIVRDIRNIHVETTRSRSQKATYEDNGFRFDFEIEGGFDAMTDDVFNHIDDSTKNA